MSACNHQIHAKNMSILSVTCVTSRDPYTIYGTWRDLPLMRDIPRGMFSPCYLRAPSDCTLTFPLCIPLRPKKRMSLCLTSIQPSWQPNNGTGPATRHVLSDPVVHCPTLSASTCKYPPDTVHVAISTTIKIDRQSIWSPEIIDWGP